MKIDNTIGPYDRIDRLNGIIKDQKSRIVELEAEVERLKAFCNEWVHNEEAFQKESAVEICPIITQEGEG